MNLDLTPKPLIVAILAALLAMRGQKPALVWCCPRRGLLVTGG